MKMYRTKEGNLLNLDNVVMIYKDPETNLFNLASVSGTIFEVPDFDLEDADKVMEYNDYLLTNN